jgi:hypothetical protein
LDSLPDELLLKIAGLLDKRDLSRCGQVSRKWSHIARTPSLWTQFSLTDIRHPKWCSANLVSLDHTNLLVEQRFSRAITRVDLSKMCFSFNTLHTLFTTCPLMSTLVVNFKYLKLTGTSDFLTDEQTGPAVQAWPVNTLEKLYLKNVCDMKIRRLNYFKSTNLNQLHQSLPSHQPYDLIEMEVIKIVRILFRNNAASLRVLGLKCVDPDVISECVNRLDSLHILLLNNVNDTDGVLQEMAFAMKNLKCLVSVLL